MTAAAFVKANAGLNVLPWQRARPGLVSGRSRRNGVRYPLPRPQNGGKKALVHCRVPDTTVPAVDVADLGWMEPAATDDKQWVTQRTSRVASPRVNV